MKRSIVATILALCLLSIPLGQSAQSTDTRYVASRQFSLDKRYANTFVNTVFKENILLTMALARGIVEPGKPVNWDTVNKPFHWVYVLNPGKTMTFHDSILPEYKDTADDLTNAHFNSTDGFLSSGYLIGDGVCHLASLLGWAAQDAGLTVVAPTNHDFATIPEVPKQEGVSIYFHPEQTSRSTMQNLYITNQFTRPMQFVFDYDGTNLEISIYELL